MPAPYSEKDKLWIPSSAKTATGVSSVKSFERHNMLTMELDITAVSGTSPTLILYLQRLLPDETNWMDIASFPQMTGTGRRVLDFIGINAAAALTPGDGVLAANTILSTPFGRLNRLKYVIGGTNPSFTFSVPAYWQKIYLS